ncbi:MAG: radical SAM family heme chaperone HemW [Ruminococcaceae bacterium]|nr:radical SAM family heme chaperone HemW [Oscillospiraceae bacterium]
MFLSLMIKMKKAGLYIHIPFCIRKCFYCDFSSFSDKYQYVDIYFENLLNELKFILNKYPDVYFDTVYIGGGTPSSVDSKYICKLVDAFLPRLLTGSEVTIEANPATVDIKKLQDYLSCGINRISIGVQSFKDDTLKSLGRIHNRSQAIDTINLAKSVGFNNINIDLIYGIPTINNTTPQTVEDWEDTLKTALSLDVDHISAYSLIIEEGTKIYDWGTEYIEDEIDREMFYKCKSMLEEKGYMQYEISNFSKPGFESRHNLKYWNCDDYIGVGLAAASCIDGVRYKNTEDFSQYNKGKYCNEQETIVLSREDQMNEFMMLGFRKIKGPAPEHFRYKFNSEYEEIFGEKLTLLVSKKLIKKEKNRYFLTKKGLDFANIVFREFI